MSSANILGAQSSYVTNTENQHSRKNKAQSDDAELHFVSSNLPMEQTWNA